MTDTVLAGLFMPLFTRETFENFKPNVYGPSAFSHNLPVVHN